MLDFGVIKQLRVKVYYNNLDVNYIKLMLSFTYNLKRNSDGGSNSRGFIYRPIIAGK